MDTLKAIACRKSIRTYTGEQISDADLKVILNAAQASPVGRSLYETLHLTVITNPELLKAIDANAAKIFGDPDMHPLYNAPTYIVVSSKAGEEGMTNVQYSNAAVMVHSMTMAAVDLGVGHCDIWGATRLMAGNPDLLTQLNLPEGFTPCCGIILGVTEEKYVEKDIPENRIGMNVVD